MYGTYVYNAAPWCSLGSNRCPFSCSTCTLHQSETTCATGAYVTKYQALAFGACGRRHQTCKEKKIFWNLFFGDARRAIQMLKFTESVFADDLHACRNYDVKVPNRAILRATTSCQERLHEWGRANAVEFEPSKESITILSRIDPYGENFKSLGVVFDPSLYMDDAISKICDSASWKLRTVQRSTRFFSTIEMVNLYKSKVGSYIESKTAAIYHASTILLNRVDNIQVQFLRQIGLTELNALCEFRLAPLNCRRDMAILGLIHRTVLGLGPNQFTNYFKLASPTNHPDGRESERRHNRQLTTMRTGKFLDILANSALGVIDVYNLLPQKIVDADSVTTFQKRLQLALVEDAKCERPGWRDMYSPRRQIFAHPLRDAMAKGVVNELLVTNGRSAKTVQTSTCVGGWLAFGAGDMNK